MYPRLPDNLPLSEFIDYTGGDYEPQGPVEFMDLPPLWDYDWLAYWREFKLLHGNHPVQIANRIVFEDGWSHDAYDLGGTEWPPPKEPDKLRQLLLDYWNKRQEIVYKLLHKQLARVEELRMLQGIKSAPLQQYTVQFGRDGTIEPITGAVSIKDMENRLQRLQEHMGLCDRELGKLNAQATR